MMKEKQIRFWLPFVLVFGGSYFLSGADIFHNFGTRFEIVKYNFKLILLFFLGDVGQMVVCFCCSLIFFTAWRLNRVKHVWYSDMYWQLGGLCFCWSLLSIVSLVANFSSFLWIQGMIRLCCFIVAFYVLNTLYRVRRKLYYPETREETIKKAQKFDELIKMIKEVKDEK